MNHSNKTQHAQFVAHLDTAEAAFRANPAKAYKKCRELYKENCAENGGNIGEFSPEFAGWNAAADDYAR